MLITETQKNYALITLIGLILLLLYLLIQKAKQVDIPGENAGTVVNVIVDNEPLPIPDIFKSFLKSKGVTGLTIGFKNGDVGLIAVEGQFINPCISNKEATGIITGYKSVIPSSTPCRFEAGIAETHMIIAKRSGTISGSDCDRCLDSENISHDCKISTNTYRCRHRPGTGCDTTCGD